MQKTDNIGRFGLLVEVSICTSLETSRTKAAFIWAAEMNKAEYAEKLKDPMWEKARKLILFRDEYTCQDCGGKREWGYELHVHHKQYINGREPWQYSSQDLITLCRRCHEKIHGRIDIRIALKPVRYYIETVLEDLRNG